MGSALLRVILCASTLLLACAPPEDASYPFVVRAESDPGVPLPGASVLRAGKALGASGADGSLSLALRGKPGENVGLEVSCPSGYRAPEKPLQVVLRPLAEQARKPEYLVFCKPELRSVVISVRAQNGAHVPLKFLGKEIARTDEHGAAHAVLKLPPGVNANFVLDTSAPEHAALRPQSPELKVTVPERDEVVLFDQPFTVEQPRVKRRREPEPSGPVRI